MEERLLGIVEYDLMRNATINAWVDLAAFVVALVSIITGYVLWVYFPLGSGRGSMDLLNISYQSCYNLHFYSSTLFVILVAIHLILHYRWIRNMRAMLVKK